jgi:hypothetical protein
MKLGTFIVAALCVATPAFADHLALIDQYQHAYGESPDPHLLTLIANEYRAANKPADALAYYCSYIFIAPAGDDADYASQQIHALRAGAESDHDACAAQRPVTRDRNVDLLAALPKVPPKISGREIAGAAIMITGIGTFGLALWQGKQGDKYSTQYQAIDPTQRNTPLAINLEQKANNYYDRQKWILAGGGAVVISGAILYLIGRHDRLKAESTFVRPNVGKRSAGLVLEGKF